MANLGAVVLVTGPMGSGKSTLAQYLAQQLGWESVSEDAYWAEHGWGSGTRSPEQEQVVQRQVIDHLLTVCRSGRSVVLEFILYSEPPNPLSAYLRACSDHSMTCRVIVLKPSIPEILRGSRPEADREISDGCRDSGTTSSTRCGSWNRTPSGPTGSSTPPTCRSRRCTGSAWT